MPTPPDPRRRRLRAALGRLDGGHGAVRIDGVGPDLVDELRAGALDAGIERVELVTGRRLERDRPLGALDGLLSRAVLRSLADKPDPGGSAADELLDRYDLDPAVVVVLDGQWLDDGSARALAIAAGRRREQGTGWVLSLRSDRPSPTVAALVEAARVDSTVDLTGFDDAELAEVVSAVVDDDVPDRVLAAVGARTGGRPDLVVALADGLAVDDDAEVAVPDTVLDLVGRRLELLDTSVRRVIEAASIAPDPTSDLVARLAAVDAATLSDTEEVLVAEGLPFVPLVLDSVRRSLGSRRASELLTSLVETGAEPAAVAARVEELGVAPADAADVLVAAADAGADSDPATAAARYRKAVELGVDPASVAARRARVEALAGRVGAAIELAESVVEDTDAPDRADALVVLGSIFAAGAQLRPSAGSYASVGDVGGAAWWSVLAQPVRSLLGDEVEGDEIEAVSAAARAAVAFAAGTAAAASTGRLDELPAAAELVELAPSADLWPDTPHAVLAATSIVSGETTAADQLLDRAIETEVGGAAFRNRHRLLRGWAALRAGRWDDAQGVLVDLAETPLGLRDRLIAVALDLAMVVRRNDLEALDQGLDAAISTISRHPPDLTSADALGELARVVALRRGFATSARLLDQLAELADDAPPWAGVVAAHRAMAASLAGADDDVVATVEPADDGLLARLVAQLRAVHGDTLDVDRVSDLAGELRDAGAVFEAAHLAGVAALRLSDEAQAKRLLLRARELRTALPSSGATEAVGLGALSERELEVARQVVSGHTHKEIGAALFISAKTVEHHVAHIRTKLGVSTRAEMLSALRTGFGLD
ncbi:MAG: helix-turn-helix transcriptional regulator [Actinomycetota bacterium]